MFSKTLATGLASLVSQACATQLLEYSTVEELTQTDPRPPCEEQPFCDRFRQFMDNPELRANSDVYYSMDTDSFTVNKT